MPGRMRDSRAFSVGRMSPMHQMGLDAFIRRIMTFHGQARGVEVAAYCRCRRWYRIMLAALPQVTYAPSRSSVMKAQDEDGMSPRDFGRECLMIGVYIRHDMLQYAVIAIVTRIESFDCDGDAYTFLRFPA